MKHFKVFSQNNVGRKSGEKKAQTRSCYYFNIMFFPNLNLVISFRPRNTSQGLIQVCFDNYLYYIGARLSCVVIIPTTRSFKKVWVWCDYIWWRFHSIVMQTTEKLIHNGNLLRGLRKQTSNLRILPLLPWRKPFTYGGKWRLLI